MAKALTFKLAEREYYMLPHVETDPLNEHDVADFVFRTESQLILAREGGGSAEYTGTDVSKFRKFIAKWKDHKHLKKYDW